MHIGAIAMVLGAVAFGQGPKGWVELAVLSGLLIALDDLYRYGFAWLRYLQGQVVVAKLVLLMVGLAKPGLLLPALWACLVLGSLISHAPGRFRQFALWGPPGPCALKGSAEPGSGQAAP